MSLTLVQAPFSLSTKVILLNAERIVLPETHVINATAVLSTQATNSQSLVRVMAARYPPVAATGELELIVFNDIFYCCCF